jgi:formate hydrogenlyase transcriptional activator
LFRRYGVQSSCTLPLSTAHRRLGGLGSALRQPYGYSAPDVQYLSLIACQVALAIDTALRSQERQHAEDQLRR